MNSEPLVSVLMTAYNREKYIGEAIESVLGSDYKDFELIIVDDGSKDNTVNIAKAYEAKDNRIKVYINQQNLGQFPNRNKTAEYAKGEYLLFVDSDDSIFADTISHLITSMKQFPEASFGMFSLHGGPLRVMDSKSAIYNHFFQKSFLSVGPGATFIKRDYFNSINKFPTEYGVPGDMYYNLKATSKSPIVLIPYGFIKYRRHEGQEINNSFDYLYNNYKYLIDALEKLPLGLNSQQEKWIEKKAKRRFFTNICKYLFFTLNIRNTFFAIKQADYGIKDALMGVFHYFPSKPKP